MIQILKNIAAISIKKLPLYARFLAAIASLVVLAFLFPTNSKFKYRFAIGQTWQYDDLFANFDFAIKKTAQEIASERESLENEFEPIYELDINVINQRYNAFNEAFNQQLLRNKAAFPDVTADPERYRSYGIYVLNRLLSRGILRTDTFLQSKTPDYLVNILRGNIAEKQTLGNLLTESKANEWLNDTLPFTKLAEPEFLLTLLAQQLSPNLAYNAEKTRQLQKAEIEKITLGRGMVRSGEPIILRGGIVTSDVYQKLISYKEEYESRSITSQHYYQIMVGYGLIIFILLGIFKFFTQNHQPHVYIRFRWTAFLLIWVLLYALLMHGIRATDFLSPYLLPFGIAPIIIKNFENRELAFFSHIINVLVVALINSVGFDFILTELVVGMVAVFSRFDTRYWSNFFKNIGAIISVSVACFVGFALIEESNWRTINWSPITWLALSGFLTLLAYPLIPLLGNLFGFTSSITLAELSDLGHPLLRELSLKAPGTLQHSLQVANLAEAAALSIGANELLVRVGALYHDVGKTYLPMYFIENQSVDGNPHDNISRIESAKLIISHVTEGARLADRFGLPKVIQDFILTHHGTTSVAYFYRLHLNENPEGNADLANFLYPGPLPKTREQGILMFADSLEAAAKSMKSPDETAIDNLVERLVNDKIEQKQLIECALTFQEVEICKASFKRMLKNIHHIRIAYPPKN